MDKSRALVQAHPRTTVKKRMRDTSTNAIGHVRVVAFTEYALTRVAYCSEATCARLCSAMAQAQSLHRDASLAAQLYERVARSSGHDVAMAELEREFDFEWALSSEGGVSSDPYYSRVLEEEIVNSLTALLDAINVACRNLPGLDPSERTTDADYEAQCACNLVCNRMGHAMINPSTTQAHLLSIAEQARTEMHTRAAQKSCERIGCQATGIRALQRLCAAVAEGRPDIGMVIDLERESISYVVRLPPACFSAELDQNGVSLTELCAYLYPAVPSRMNGCVLEMSVGRWAATHYHVVSAACINSLNELRQLSHASPMWHGYSGVAVWHKQTCRDLIAAAAATGGYGAVTNMPVLSHVHAGSSYVLAAAAITPPAAMRVARIASVVHSLVRLNILQPRVVRSEHVLALVGRFGCEAELAHERLVNDEADVETDAMEVSIAVPPPPPVPSVAAPEMASQSLIVTLREATRVPKSLQRDYVLIAVIRDQLMQCFFMQEKAFVGITATSERLNGVPDLGEPVTPMITRFSKPSLTAALGHVMNEKIAKGVEDWAKTQAIDHYSEGDVQYGDTPAFVSGTKGLSITRQGRQVLMNYTSWVVQQMQPPTGPIFANTWHSSRSAKSHARRKQGPVPSGS